MLLKTIRIFGITIFLFCSINNTTVSVLAQENSICGWVEVPNGIPGMGGGGDPFMTVWGTNQTLIIRPIDPVAFHQFNEIQLPGYVRIFDPAIVSDIVVEGFSGIENVPTCEPETPTQEPTNTQQPPTQTPTQVPTNTQQPPTLTLTQEPTNTQKPSTTPEVNSSPTKKAQQTSNFEWQKWQIAAFQLEDYSGNSAISAVTPLKLTAKLQTSGDQVYANDWEDYSGQIVVKNGDNELMQVIDFPGDKDSVLIPQKMINDGQFQLDIHHWNLTVYNILIDQPVQIGVIELFLFPKGQTNHSIVASQQITVQSNRGDVVACSVNLANKFIDILPVPSGAKSMQTSSSIAAQVNVCKDRGCAINVVVTEIGKLLLSEGLSWKKIPVGDILVKIHDLFNGEEDLKLCDNTALWVWDFIKEVSHQGFQVNLYEVHSPVLLLTTDSSDRQAGFLEEDKTVSDIYGSIVFKCGEGKYVLVPNQTLVVDLKGISNGSMTFGLVQSDGEHVVDETYTDLPITEQTVGVLQASPQEVKFLLDVSGQGQYQVLDPDYVTMDGNVIASKKTKGISNRLVMILLSALLIIIGIAVIFYRRSWREKNWK